MREERGGELKVTGRGATEVSGGAAVRQVEQSVQ